MIRTALLFSGQGSQYIGMGKKLYEIFPIFKKILEEANQLLGYDLKEMCFQGDINELTKTIYAQPAIYTISYAMYMVYMNEIGIEPSVCAGHSLGEFAALTSAGAFSFSDGLSIVKIRGQLMEEALESGIGGMAAIIGLDKSVIEEECKKLSSGDGIVTIANYNSKKQVVISGHKVLVEKAGEKIRGIGGIYIPLKVSAAFHSPLMKSVSIKFRDELLKYKINDKLKFTVLSNIDALPYKNSNDVVEKLYQQITMPVLWEKIIQAIKEKDIDTAIELGPKDVLKKIIKETVGEKVKVFSFDSMEDVESLRILLRKDNEKYLQVIIKCMKIAMCTPNKNWDDEEYRTGVVEPYRKIKNMLKEIEGNTKQATYDTGLEALELLKLVFNTKKATKEYQQMRLETIFNETGTKEIFSKKNKD